MKFDGMILGAIPGHDPPTCPKGLDSQDDPANLSETTVRSDVELDALANGRSRRGAGGLTGVADRGLAVNVNLRRDMFPAWVCKRAIAPSLGK